MISFTYQTIIRLYVVKKKNLKKRKKKGEQLRQLHERLYICKRKQKRNKRSVLIK